MSERPFCFLWCRCGAEKRVHDRVERASRQSAVCSGSVSAVGVGWNGVRVGRGVVGAPVTRRPSPLPRHTPRAALTLTLHAARCTLTRGPQSAAEIPSSRLAVSSSFPIIPACSDQSRPAQAALACRATRGAAAALTRPARAGGGMGVSFEGGTRVEYLSGCHSIRRRASAAARSDRAQGSRSW